MKETFPASAGFTPRDPKRWDQGCQNDHVRNCVIIPDLRSRIAKTASRKCCDVGAGTGYVTRMLAKYTDLPHVSWTLLESDRHMLQFSRETLENEALSAKIAVSEFDVINPSKQFLESFDFAFCCFSSLEFGMSKAIARNMMSLLMRNGLLVIYLPDLLEEVVQAILKSKDPCPLELYRRHAIEVQKPDRFTGRIEPFSAYRIERLIMDFLNESTACTRLDFLDRGDDRKIIALEFVKCMP